MKNRRIGVLGMSVTRNRGKEKGKELRDGYVLTYSGVEEGRRMHGVEIIMELRIPYIEKMKLVSERLMKCTFNLKNKLYHFYQIYAPQQGGSEEEKTEFMEVL